MKLCYFEFCAGSFLCAQSDTVVRLFIWNFLAFDQLEASFDAVFVVMLQVLMQVVLSREEVPRFAERAPSYGPALHYM